MTLTELLQELHILLNKDTDYPESTEDDYLVRKALLNNAIRVWESEEGINWKELFVSLSDASTGEDTVVANQSEYDTPSDFLFPVGFLRITDSSGASVYYNLVDPEDKAVLDNDSGNYCFWVTGNKKTGKVIHIHPTPGTSDAGKAINYEYYKGASTLSSGTDVIEMSDPQFAIYWALSELVSDEDPGLSSKYLDIAQNKLGSMRVRNGMAAPYGSGSIKDQWAGFGDEA